MTPNFSPTPDLVARVLRPIIVNHMKRVILLVLLSLAVSFSTQAADRPAEKFVKGAELYSWQDPTGAWLFAILPGTDVFKPDELIKKTENQLKGQGALEKRFMSLAEGESVTWVERKGFPLPDEKTIGHVVSSAKKAKVDLHVPPAPGGKG